MGGTDVQSPSYDQGQTACHKETSNMRKSFLWPGANSMSQSNFKHEEGALSFTPSLDINNEDPHSGTVTPLSPFSIFHKFPSTNIYIPAHFLVILFQSMWNIFWWERSDFTVRRVCKINLQMLREGLATAGSAQSLGACTDLMGDSIPWGLHWGRLFHLVIVRYSWQ